MTRSISTFVVGALVVLALTVSVSAQTTYLSEDFSSAAGATPPAGWTTSATGTNPAPWLFNDPGGRAPGAPFVGQFAISDADFNGGGTSGISTLTSSAFDVSGAGVANLSFDQHLRDLTSGWSIEVFDGAVWNVVAQQLNNTTGGDIGYPGAPVNTMYDVTAAAGASNAAQVRFVYEYGFDWWWAIDNVLVDEPAAFDLAMVSVDAPNFGAADCILPTGPSTTICTIMNAGAATIPAGTLVQMQLRVDGVNIAAENVLLPAAIAPGGTFQYTYTAGSPITTVGPHDVLCRVVLAGDANAANDAVTRNYVVALNTVVQTIGWLEDFESHATSTGTTVVPAGWTNDPNDSVGTNADWRNDQGTTPSNAGPNVDHTTGTTTGWYMHIEDSTQSSTSPINLITPCLDLSGASNPTLLFWHWSDEPVGSLADNILEIDVIDATSGNAVTMSVATFPTNGAGSGWVQQSVDLSAFLGNTIQVVFRGRNDNGSSFSDDEAIDDVSLVDFVFDTGQAPQPGLAVFDIDSSTNLLGFGVGSGQPGPYFTSVTQGGPFTISFEGQPNQPLTSFFAPLNRASATFGPIGQMDCGIGAITGMGFPADLIVFGNGILWATTPGAPFGFDALWITNGAGTGALTLNMPNFGAAPGTVLTTFQFGILSPAAPFSYLSNAVELTLN